MRNQPVVLVVEDNAELRHVLKEALGSEGYDVLAARDETDALELLRSNSVDLLISDLSGALRGASVPLESLRQEFPELPVVALSGPTGGPALLSSAWQSRGRYRTLSKPFRLGELLAVSREVLRPAG
jgi:DNA-binding response OmpR family regulator